MSVNIPQAQLIERSKIKPNPNNIKKHPQEQIDALVQIVKRFPEIGFAYPVILDDNNELLAGHLRLIVAEILDMPMVPFIRAGDMTKDRREAYMILENKITEMGSWDKDKMKLIFAENDFDFKPFHMDFTQFKPLPKDADDIPTIPVETTVKRGDIYELGNHRIMCGDSTDKEDLDKLMKGDIATITFTNPQYNAGNNALGGNKKMVDSKYLDSEDKMENYLEYLVQFTNLALKKSIYTFVNIQMLAKNKEDIISWLFEFKKNYVDVIIWSKHNGNPAFAENVLNSNFEFIYIFKNEDNPSRAIKTGNPFRGTISNVYEGSSQTNNKFSEIHAATFPVHLPLHFILNFTKTNDIVFEPFLGTGTTLIACQQSERICYGMEIDPRYVDVTIQRYEGLTGQKAVKLS